MAKRRKHGYRSMKRTELEALRLKCEKRGFRPKGKPTLEKAVKAALAEVGRA